MQYTKHNHIFCCITMISHIKCISTFLLVVVFFSLLMMISIWTETCDFYLKTRTVLFGCVILLWMFTAASLYRQMQQYCSSFSLPSDATTYQMFTTNKYNRTTSRFFNSRQQDCPCTVFTVRNNHVAWMYGHATYVFRLTAIIASVPLHTSQLLCS
jgi:hypothetical protein